MEMRLLTVLRGLRAWLYAFFFFTPALAFAQLYGDDRYYERGWGFWNGFWIVAIIAALLGGGAWFVVRRGRDRRNRVL